MELIRGLHNWPADGGGCALTIGNFDGVHLGHQALIRRTVELARVHRVPATILSFEPTPREYFGGASAGRVGTLRGKLLDLQALGVDRLVIQRFGRGFAGIEATVFVRDLLVARMGLRALVVGDDFRFGARRAGDLDLLRHEAARHGFAVEGLGSVLVSGRRCSSTAVRESLAAPALTQTEQLLGRPYRIVGRVRGGLRLGRQLGMPTANIPLLRRPAVRLGVYAVTVRRLDEAGGGPWPAVANIGVRPTLATSRCLLETHLLEGGTDLYGAVLEVRLRHFLRAEQRFASLEALAAQMQRDKDAALAFFAAQPA